MHNTSSAYHAAGNSCIERANCTVIQLLKGDLGRQWDTKLYRMVINYNNSNVHSITKLTPSQCILTREHEVRPKLPVEGKVVKTWKEGNPKFCPFKVGQKVLRKIHRIGNLLIGKLEDKYEGPYVVKKVQSNGLSYEIGDLKNGNKTCKVNHRHLITWHEIPNYTRKFLGTMES